MSIVETPPLAPQSFSRTDATVPQPKRYPHRWTVLAALLVFWLLLSFAVLSSVHQTNGKLMYILDDPYISAAMARNLLQHGTLGVTRYGYSSSSSSIVWPFLLTATDLVTRSYEYSPFILN